KALAQAIQRRNFRHQRVEIQIGARLDALRCDHAQRSIAPLASLSGSEEGQEFTQDVLSIEFPCATDQQHYLGREGRIASGRSRLALERVEDRASSLHAIDHYRNDASVAARRGRQMPSRFGKLL